MCTHAREVTFMILPREPKVLLYPRASATTVVEHYRDNHVHTYKNIKNCEFMFANQTETS